MRGRCRLWGSLPRARTFEGPADPAPETPCLHPAFVVNNAFDAPDVIAVTKKYKKLEFQNFLKFQRGWCVQSYSSVHNQ